ncbi:MAG: peptidoglycan bridge formation glycyltransferase FemA/FemB family protein [Actinobacteria bacterium]|uniref:Unannotated protein n=1 Tax=freshwater metagenome TaxID=449393 RepID=A0A6J5YPS6_9ZZZZ|nr:peptidoglycan bridge formation glycyltransferase FemA/FemB family protein [Actinomycetota bacterium]
MTITVREISREQHLDYIATRPSVSFLQTPAWGAIKSEWTAHSLGWFDQDVLIGAGLLLLRKVPRVNRYLAYLPEGPDLAWDDSHQYEQALAALTDYARNKRVFQIKIGPHVWVRRWDAEVLKEAIAQESATTISDLTPSNVNPLGLTLTAHLSSTGWKQRSVVGEGFGDYQPRFVFQLSLEQCTEEDIFSGFNQLWRRNIRKADSAGVTIHQGTRDDLQLFHSCYVETASRDGFTPRSLNYFERMWDNMTSEDSQRIQLFIAQHPDHHGAIAATTMTMVGTHAWYSYGSSTTASRDLRPSNAIQWHMIKAALAAGADVYDLRGISDTLDPNHHLFGLIQFKLGTGGYAQEYVGEWDYVLSPFWARAFDFYMARR